MSAACPQNFAICDYEGAPETPAALKLVPMSLVRPGELRQAECSEIDVDARATGASGLIPDSGLLKRFVRD